MPRTETKGPGDTVVCTACEGSGEDAMGFANAPCGACGGNGYVPAAEPTIHDALKTLREAEPVPLIDYMTDEEFNRDRSDENPNVGKLSSLDDIDLTNTKPVPGRMANQTWRILEEQRMAAEETIAECEAEIERWSDKMVDAIKAKRICEAGQAALEGEA